MSGQVWFITGASSGFGYESTKHVLENGGKAVATLRNPAKAPKLAELSSKYPDTLLILPFDVTKTETIRPTFDKAIEKFGRIDVVFNNAGYGIVGEAENTPEAIARKQFEVNFWAVVFISQEAVRIFRDVNPKTGAIGGILFQSSSSSSVANVPGTTFYSTTKAAINSFSQAFQSELDPTWNITISAVGFGYYYTGALDASEHTPVHPAYGTHLASHMVRTFAKSKRVPGGSEPVVAVTALYKLAQGPRSEIPIYLPLGLDSVGLARKAAEQKTSEADIGEKVSKDFPVAKE